MDWVFQCNPKRYDLASEIEKGTQTEDWSMNQHRERVSPGDRVFFWQTGLNARLLAVGHVDSPVYEQESPFGNHRVDIIFDYKILPPVTRPEVLEQQALSTFAPFKGIMGTNFPILNAETATALEKLVEGRLASFSAAVSPAPAIGDAHIALDEAIKKARYQISLSLREYISAMDAIAFQWLVRALLIKLGYTDVIVSKASGDGGVDVRQRWSGVASPEYEPVYKSNDSRALVRPLSRTYGEHSVRMRPACSSPPASSPQGLSQKRRTRKNFQ
jgi:EVE domain/Restriction endonuclease